MGKGFQTGATCYSVSRYGVGAWAISCTICRLAVVFMASEMANEATVEYKLLAVSNTRYASSLRSLRRNKLKLNAFHTKLEVCKLPRGHSHAGTAYRTTMAAKQWQENNATCVESGPRKYISARTCDSKTFCRKAISLPQQSTFFLLAKRSSAFVVHGCRRNNMRNRLQENRLAGMKMDEEGWG
ncbi:hypothetical protein BaRGS_00004530 [Batillaria attramentaria]|uniref:Uncharacterized protein n=1 Tax=Batillaria attramentaria TaxID=370345 RepID=A0ABD0LYJ6_9CAEN